MPPLALLFAGLAIGLAAAATWQATRGGGNWVQVGPHRVELGESYDGDPLPARHPLARPADLRSAGTTADAGTGAAALQLRRHCAWGIPGRNPYRGTVEAALLGARLPAEVVHRISNDIRDARPADRVTITNAAIRSDDGTREFNPRRFAMTYGRTLCVDARVNFAPGHSERGSLYEATDERGRRHSVMVPDVCGNVSVLTTRDEEAVASAEEGAAEGHAGHAEGGGQVPEPGTLALVALGLAFAAGRAAWPKR